MILVNSSFLSGVHAYVAREQMLTRHAILLSVLIIRVSCVFSQEQLTMSRDPWRRLRTRLEFNFRQTRISKVEFENCFEFVNFCESVDEALPTTSFSTSRWW